MEIVKLKKELIREIKRHSNIYIIGHNYIDLDAFGAILGAFLIVKKFNKKPYIIIEDKELEPGVKKAIDKVKKLNIIKSNEIKDFEDSLLIIVDTNKEKLISCNYMLESFSNIIVIDHHDTGKETIKNANLYIDSEASSTCEIFAYLLKKLRIKFSEDIATILLSGIVLDTNNFILRADKDTFYCAHYLVSKNASPIEVQYLLKQDIKKFITRQKMLTNVRIIDKNIAIAKGVKNVIYRREDLAKVAETLLLFNNIETSFVIGYLNNKEIGISGRTLGKNHIGRIMSELNGGGNKVEGATKIISNDINEVEDQLIEILKD